MKKQFIFHILFIILFCSCLNKKKYPITKETWENGEKTKITYINDSLYMLAQYYNDGKLKSITLKKNNHIKEGECILFYPSGIMKEKGNYKNDKEDGMWYYYSEDGLLIKQLEYLCSSCEYPLANTIIYYDKNVQIDTTKENEYFTLQPIQDTIYFGEPYLLRIILNNPYFPNGMDIVFVDDISEFCEIEKNKGFKKRVECKGFEHTLSYKDYQIGHNEIKGIILNYNDTKKNVIPLYFSKSFYVKELPRFQNDTKAH